MPTAPLSTAWPWYAFVRGPQRLGLNWRCCTELGEPTTMSLLCAVCSNAARFLTKQANFTRSQDGDLSRSGNYQDAEPLMEFPACAPQSWQVQDSAAMESIVSPIAAHIDLSVGWPGNNGIIGRRISIINSSGRVAGDGVVGWN